MTHNKRLCTRDFPLEDPIHFLQTPKEAKIYYTLQVIRTIGLYRIFVRDGCLLPVNRWIPIGCNTFLWASRASSCDASLIKKLI